MPLGFGSFLAAALSTLAEAFAFPYWIEARFAGIHESLGRKQSFQPIERPSAERRNVGLVGAREAFPRNLSLGENDG